MSSRRFLASGAAIAIVMLLAAFGGVSASSRDRGGTTMVNVGDYEAARAPASVATPIGDEAQPIPAGFRAEVLPIAGGREQLIALSWREGCPVGPSELRLVELSYRDVEGRTRTGRLIVHADVAEDIVSVFARLYEIGFPIRQMRLVDDFGADDLISMQANNTSAFNCRPVAGTSRWSEHAYGRAVDINPLVNPYVRRSGTASPPEGAPYVERRPGIPGAIYDGDAVVTAFADIGWSWGGNWASVKDYQHFSQSGR